MNELEKKIFKDLMERGTDGVCNDYSIEESPQGDALLKEYCEYCKVHVGNYEDGSWDGKNRCVYDFILQDMLSEKLGL